MAIRSKNGALLADSDGFLLENCCCDQFEGHAPSTVSLCLSAQGCGQSYPHAVGMQWGGGTCLLDPQTMNCSPGSRCCPNGLPSGSFPTSGTKTVYGPNAGYTAQWSDQLTIDTTYAYLDFLAWSSFGSGATNCRCNLDSSCSPKGKYGWQIAISAAGHAVKIWDITNGGGINRAPDYTIARGGSRSFGPGCSATQLWAVTSRRLIIRFEG